MEKSNDERRKRFFPTVSLGNILAVLVFAGTGVGIYTSTIADVSNSKVEISNIKQDAVKREAAEKESRQEIRQDIRDVKLDVKDLNAKLDKVLQEVIKRNNK